MRRAALILCLLAAAVSGCAKKTLPPGDPMVCYHVVTGADGKLKYNRLAQNVPNLETCAANLEAMRLKFLRMGGNIREITGAYQGSYDAGALQEWAQRIREWAQILKAVYVYFDNDQAAYAVYNALALKALLKP